MSNRMTRLFKEPLIQFLIIGAAIYGAYAIFGSPEDDYRDNMILVDSNRINAMISGWESRWQRPPTRQEIDGLIQQYIKEDVLYRQAVAMGLNEDDPITRRRMAQKLEFLTADLVSTQEPDETELEAFFLENRDAYRPPELITFGHVFVDPDVRGEATLPDAEKLLVELRAGGKPNEQDLQRGDRIMVQNYFASATELDVRRQMGSGFSEPLMQLEPGQWHGPVLSGFGVHLVYIYGIERAPPANLEDVRTQVIEDWHQYMREEFNAQFVEGLMDQYEIVIEALPEDRLLDGQQTNSPEGEGSAGNQAQADANS